MLNRAVNRAQNYILPAPVGGLNQRDNLDTMPLTDAIVMDNYYPSETKVCLRGGYKLYALGGKKIKTETLMNFNFPNHNRLFAAADGKIFNITSSVYFMHICTRFSACICKKSFSATKSSIVPTVDAYI